jgi:hypothetical protein
LIRSRVIRVERHEHGARRHVAGVRLHQWHLGSGMLLTLAAGSAFDRVHMNLATVLAAVAGLWLLAKDWTTLTRRAFTIKRLRIPRAAA